MTIINSILKALEKSNHQNEPIITRFAPSPTGHLHLGHVASAVYTFGIAKALKAKVHLRIEDHDKGRSRTNFVHSIIDDLIWLGFLPEADNKVKFDKQHFFSSEFIQSNNLLEYNHVLKKLIKLDKIFACECSRKDIHNNSIKTNDTELFYPNICVNKKLDLNSNHSLRIKLPEVAIKFLDILLGEQTQIPKQQIGSLLIRDREQNWSYHYCNVIDDINQNVNLIIRGEDILPSTGRQILLASLLMSNRKNVYLHHPLIFDKSGKKLSKRDQSTSIDSYRKKGLTKEEIIGLAAFQVGLTKTHQRLSASDISELFF